MALSANTALQTRNRGGMTRRAFVIQTSSVIYKHAMVEISTVTGRARPCSDSTTGTFVGIADDIGNITYPVTGDGSTVYVYVLNNLEVLLPTVTAITVGQTNIVNLYANDDQTVTDGVSVGGVVGVMTQFVAANSAWIMLRETTAGVGS